MLFRYDLVDSAGRIVRELDSVIEGSGRVTLTGESVGASGSFRMERPLADWSGLRVRISAEDWVLGTYTPHLPGREFTSDSVTGQVGLLDSTALAAAAPLGRWLTVSAGTPISEAIQGLLAEAGLDTGSVTDEGAVVRRDASFTPQSTLLDAVNELAQSAGFRGLETSPAGKFKIVKARSASEQPNRAFFQEGENCRYTSNFRHQRDVSTVPNRVVVTAGGSAEAPGLRAVAENVDPESEFSYPSIGRWITHTESVKDAVSTAELFGHARRILAEKSTAENVLEIEFLPAEIRPHDVVRFTSSRAELDIRAVVEQVVYPLASTGLASARLREVVL